MAAINMVSLVKRILVSRVWFPQLRTRADYDSNPDRAASHEAWPASSFRYLISALG